MKVHIGPYKTFWGIYQILELLTYVGVNKDTTHNWATAAPKWISDFLQWMHDKRTRVIKVEVHDYDVWNADSTMAILILPLLKKLKEKTRSAPGDMLGFQQTSNFSAQSTFDFYADGDESVWNAGHTEWHNILDEMIWTFEQLQPDYDWEAQYWKVLPELGVIKGSCDRADRIAHFNRIQKGLELFGRYYQSLWD